MSWISPFPPNLPHLWSSQSSQPADRAQELEADWLTLASLFHTPTSLFPHFSQPADRAKEFEALNCQVIAASTDTEECHLAWIR